MGHTGCILPLSKVFSRLNMLNPHHQEPTVGKMLKEIDPSSLFLGPCRIFPSNQEFAAILSEFFEEPHALLLKEYIITND